MWNIPWSLFIPSLLGTMILSWGFMMYIHASILSLDVYDWFQSFYKQNHTLCILLPCVSLQYIPVDWCFYCGSHFPIFTNLVLSDGVVGIFGWYIIEFGFCYLPLKSIEFCSNRHLNYCQFTLFCVWFGVLLRWCLIGSPLHFSTLP